MAVLDDIKVLQGVNDTSKDDLFNLYIRKATTLIAKYLNIPTTAITKTDYWTGKVTTIEPIDIPTTYPDAVIEYVMICLNKRGNEGEKQFSQGSRSGSYETDVPDSVKALLSQPYVTLLGTRRW